MGNYWKLMVKNLWPWASPPPDDQREPQAKPRPPASPEVSAAPRDSPDWYPRTFQRDESEGPIQMPPVFDPALQHFRRAFRQGEPVFQDEQVGIAWRAARRQVIQHLLRLVAESEWRDSLVLRGSVLLTTWLGDLAREPGDIDWLVTPATLRVGHRFSKAILDGLIQLVARRSRVGNTEILASEAAADDIWAYDRAPGRRIVFPWRCEGLPRGFTQLDFVFQEELLWPAHCMPIAVDGSKPAELRTASPELSLAWKLLWLENDTYPQGKDLYDATLLAEQFRLPRELLIRVLEPTSRGLHERFGLQSIRGWDVDWENFQREYPSVPGTAADWQARLIRALESTFAAAK